MIKQTFQTSGFGKKTYAKPQMKAYQVKPMSIICTSPSTTSTQNEEYEEVSTTTTNAWFK